MHSCWTPADCPVEERGNPGSGPEAGAVSPGMHWARGVPQGGGDRGWGPPERRGLLVNAEPCPPGAVHVRVRQGLLSDAICLATVTQATRTHP